MTDLPQPAILILGRTYNQIPLVKRIQARAYRAVVVGTGKGCPEIDSIADAVSTLDTSDISAVHELARRENVKGLTTCGTSTAICTITAVSKELKLSDKMISPEVALNAVHKDRFRKIIPECLPNGGFASSQAEAVELAAALEYPIILKPGDGGGGKGITVIDKFSPETTTTAFDYACSFGRTQKVIVEEFLPGPVLGVESLIFDGRIHPLAIADKLVSTPPRCVTLGVAFPSNLPEITRKAILELNQRAINKLGINWGAVHIDMALNARGEPHIVDIGPRLAGGEIMARLIPESYQYDVYNAVISMAVGELPPEPGKNDGKFYGTRFLVSEKSGILRGIHWERDCFKQCSLLSIRQLIPDGSKVTDVDNDGARLLMFTSSSATYKELTDKLDKFSRQVSLTITE